MNNYNYNCRVEETGTKSIFGQGSYMNPNDTRQYLYKLTPVAPVDKNTKV